MYSTASLSPWTTLSMESPKNAAMLPRRVVIVAFFAVLATAYACKTDADCSLNGLCSGGSCVCDAAWGGAKCASFNVLPANKTTGYRQIEPQVPANISSWGGGSWYDETDKKW